MLRIAILLFALVFVGCGKKAEVKDETPASETPAETTPADTTETPEETAPVAEEAPKELTAEEKEKICSQPIQKGDCKAALKRFGYDAEKNVCEQFTYSGCGGTANAFRSREECESTCEKPAE